MARDQVSSASNAGGGAGDVGGPNERPDTGDAGRGDDPWRRIDSEKADRAEVFKQWDRYHDPLPAFEQAARPPARDTSRDRELTVDEFTPQQRADLEQAHGRPLEDIVARREQARAAEAAKPDTAPEALQPRADLPSDDVYNELVAAYNRGDLPYHDVRDRFASLDASPVHAQPQPTDTGDRADDPAETGRDESGGSADESAERIPREASRTEVARDDQAQQPEQQDERSDRSGDVQAPSDQPGETGVESQKPGSDREGASAEQNADLADRDAVAGGSGDGFGRADLLVPQPEESDDNAEDSTAEAPRPEQFSMEPPELTPGAYVSVRVDEHGRPDWNDAHLDTGEPLRPEPYVEVDDRTAQEVAPTDAALGESSVAEDDPSRPVRTDNDQPADPASTEAEGDEIAPPDETITEIVETRDGLTYERPERVDNPPVEETSEDQRTRVEKFKQIGANGAADLSKGVTRLGNALHDGLVQPSVAQPEPTWQPPQPYGHPNAGPGDAVASVGLALFAAVTGVHAAKQRWDNRSRDKAEE